MNEYDSYIEEEYSAELGSNVVSDINAKKDDAKSRGSSIKPPPLKRTFIDNSDNSEPDDFPLIDAGTASTSKEKTIYLKPDWKFPIKRIQKIDDDELFSSLREKFSVKNIVSQLKRSV